MRRFAWILTCCLLLTGSMASAIEFFGDVLYWQATEPVDWSMNTNASTTAQFVAFETVAYDFNPGFRVGAALEPDWGAKLYYTRFYTTAEGSIVGNVTPMFFGSREVLMVSPTPLFFETGSVQSAIDYNVLDLDFGKPFQPAESLKVRPVLGLRAAWLNQTFNTAFQGTITSGTQTQTITSNEHIENNFWGVGPKLGVENALRVWSGEKCKIDLALNFYASYLVGWWVFNDVAVNTTNQTPSSFEVPIKDRQFGALAFQAMAGVNLQCGRWNVTAGYEMNDWLNQCQIFDDSTGPHNNDLIVQGLTIRATCAF
jgi:hypothetical protein